MKLLREYIRELLKEKGELGKKVFAQSAPEGSRHAGDEPDTELETSLKRALANHLFAGGISSKELGELGPYILRFMDDPDYNDVFIRYPAGEVCRGTRLSLLEAKKLIPGFKDMPLESATGRTHAFQKFEAWTQKVSVAPFEYSPKSGNEVSSWSTDSDRVCTRFAKKNADLWGYNVGVILYADASQNDFLDFSELYKFGALSKHSHEREVAAFGPVTVTAVKVYKEVTEEQWAEVQTEVELGRPK